MKSGYYWYFTLVYGKRLEDEPSICYFDRSRYTIQLIGCEYEFDAVGYELVKPIVFGE